LDSLIFDLFRLRRSYLDRALRPAEVIDEVLRRVERFRNHNVWISVRGRDELLAEAKSLEQRDPGVLPLYGIPFAVKDNIDVRGLPTTAACPKFSRFPEQTAFAVQLLIDAGAILIGKTNLDQFATGLTGTRSPEPYGICRNAINPDYLSGGSSSGSAVAVALNLVSFSLGTDTAGSGRVPAAFNKIVGLKPSQGLISCAGVVPACKSLDCVSVFSRSAAEAALLFNLLNVADPADVYSRPDRCLLDTVESIPADGLRIGVPRQDQLQFFGDAESGDLFLSAVAGIRATGAAVEEVDFTPFREAADMLYEGPWIADRYSAIRPFLEANPDALHPVTAKVFGAAEGKTAVAAFEALHRLAELKRRTGRVLATLSCVVVPTAGRTYRIVDALADPLRVNTNLGYYTNYMNLLDLCAVAMPAGVYANGLPFGITLFANALADLRVVGLARRFLGERTDLPPCSAAKDHLLQTSDAIKIAVCGAHMRGLPLNGQLLDLGARFCAATRTSANYRLYALKLAPPERPGLVRETADGAPIAVEVWAIPKANFADFVSKIRHPLCIGSVELEDGRWEYGFLCEPQGTRDAADITAYGGWRNYLSSR
jgi:allophanate hydrolase